MRVLLDESLPRQLAGHLVGHDITTVQSAGWSGMRNGDLLRVAVAEEFDVFVTADQGIEFQHSVENLGLAVIALRAQSNRIEDLLPLVPGVVAILSSVPAPVFYRVPE